MYTTLVGMAPGATEPSALTSPPESPHPPKPRQKRVQVARACDWCRIHRIKCDNHLPCSNCKKRRGQCNQGAIEVRTLPHAYRKIERLESRVRELEQELENERRAKRPGIALNTPHTTPPSSTSPGSSNLGIARASSPLSDHESSSERKRSPEGVHVRTARSQQETWYGPSSLLYFIRRVNTFLNTSLQQSRPINRMLPDSTDKLFDGPPEEEQGHQSTSAAGQNPVAAGSFLTPTQEEYFVGLYWQTFHTTHLVLDEVVFKEHYQSLWAVSGRGRKSSALVDIVIALCLQYGHANGSAASLRVNGNDATVVSRWYYQRCQKLLTNELESPTLLTLQCHILSSVYLCWGFFPNMADSTCTLAVRTAYMLGLHLDPPPEMPQREREMRKRLWWTLYVLDSKLSMKLGRPFLLDHTNITCSLPRDDHEAATSSGSVYAPLGEDVTWLTFNLETIKLFLAVRAAYTAFYKKQLSAPSTSHDHTSRGNSDIESHAHYLGPYIDRIDDWVKGVPSAIKTKRQDYGTPFSTDFSPLEIEQFASPWLQRQRLLLELMYHNLCINLYRPFIRFAPTTTPTPTADKMATQCASHAIMLTHIMHQVLSSTSILTGWAEAFQWQWNATMSLIGFVVAYPQVALTPAAKSAIDLSVAVFEISGGSFATAASAAAITRELSTQADVLTKQTKSGQDLAQKAEEMSLTTQTSGLPENESLTDNSSTVQQTQAGAWNYDDGVVASMQDMLAESMDMAFSVDTQDFGMLLWPDMSNDFQATPWTQPQYQI
ncbi:fungal-specific transcription factor domain-containing protein [Hypomontagnella submonticulosa]|nr:fungal-specific transcription factor domain-containing protein [Hypomontagnella submonticulosa]